MIIFLILVAFLVAILYAQIISAFMANPGLNGLIIGVLLIGIAYAFRQIVRLFPEIRWVNAFHLLRAFENWCRRFPAFFCWSS